MPVGISERFQGFFNLSADCQFYVMLAADGQFRYVHVNPAALSITGKAREDEVLGLTPREALGDEYGAVVEANLLQAARQRRLFHFRGRLGAAGSGPIYDAQYIPFIDDDGLVAGVLGSARDITKIVELSEELDHLDKIETLGAMSASVIHDFNNIISSMQALLRLLEKPDSENPRKALVVSEGYKAIDKALYLTNKLATFSRRGEISSVPIDVGESIASIDGMLRRAVGQSTELTISIAPNVWAARCDSAQFEIVLLNLATNARDAIAKHGRVHLTAQNGYRNAATPDLPEMYVEITMQDNGCGMSPEIAKRALEPFFTTKPLGQGTGLGLSGALKFARDAGGTIRLSSVEGEGTSVSIYLPRSQRDLR